MGDPYADALGISTAPAPLRANNPGALMPGGKMAAYSSPEDGLSAMDGNLQSYGKQGVNTLAGVISKWAPPNQNNTQAYIADVSKRLGLDPNQQIDLSNPMVRHAIGTGIMLHESGPSAVFGGKPTPKAQATAAPMQAPAANDPYADALGFGTTKVATAPAPAPAAKPFDPNDISSAEGGFSDMGKVLAHGATSLGASIYGGLRGLGTLATGGSLNDATNQIEDAQQKYTYNPPAGSSAANALGLAGAKYSPLTLLNKGTAALGDKTLSATGSPALATLADAGTNLAAQLGVGKVVSKALAPAAKAAVAAPPRVEPTLNGAPVENNPSPSVTPDPTVQRPVPVGPQAATPAYKAPALSEASPELQATVQQAQERGQPVNQDVLNRHVEAETLPVPMRLTQGQASLDPAQISAEMNARGGKAPLVSPDFYNQQGKQLGMNLDAIREQAAPKVTATDPVQHGQNLIDAYKNYDAPVVADISAKYKALEDANGGQFPLDGQALAANVQAALDKALKSSSVPTDLKENLDKFANGRQMTFQDFETMRSDAADAQRTATDGRQRAAAAIVREQLEAMPLTPEAAALKPLADAARAAAKARFDALDADPAYKAAVTDDVAPGQASPLADKFVQKYVIGAPRANVLTMKANLAADPIAQQTIPAATIDYLRAKAKADVETGGFNQATYNGVLDQLRPKFDAVLDQKSAQQVQQLGRVAKYTKVQPQGSFVNNSNTLVGAAGEVGKSIASNYLAMKTMGLSKGVEAAAGIVKRNKASQQATAPGAGVTKLSDLGKN